MRKLLIVPGHCNALGGTLVTLSLVIKGFEQCGMQSALRVVVRENSTMADYLQQQGQGAYLQMISAANERQFFQRSIAWVNRQPPDHVLLLDNCVARELLPVLITASAGLRLSGRKIYHFCHDLAIANSRWKNLLRQFAFACLSPEAICNSHFTAQHTQRLMPRTRGILYQPVDADRFYPAGRTRPAPTAIRAILDAGAKIMLTPSRISRSGIVNDKNLHALIPVVAQLKQKGQHFHSVIIGEDDSPQKLNTKALIDAAVRAGVADRLTVLAPVIEIEDYYHHATAVVTLAPREPFGRTVVEAIACGVPVIASMTGGTGEILRQAAPEWQVDPGNPAQVADAIIRSSQDQNTEKILAHAQKWVSAECCTAAYARKLIQLTGLKDK